MCTCDLVVITSSWSLRACLFFFPRLIWYHCVSLLSEVRNRNLFYLRAIQSRQLFWHWVACSWTLGLDFIGGFGLLIVCSLFAHCLHALEATSPETLAYTWRHFQDSILSLKGICFIFYLKPEDIRLSVHAHMHWLKAQYFFSTWPRRCVYVMEGMPSHRSNSGDIWYSTIGLKKRVIFGEKFKGIVNKCNCVMNMNICIALIHICYWMQKQFEDLNQTKFSLEVI